MALPFNKTFAPLDILLASDMNNLIANDQALVDGSAFADRAIKSQKVDFATQWKNIALSNTASGKMRYFVDERGMCHMSVDGSYNGGASDHVVATLPATIRPVHDEYHLIRTFSNTNANAIYMWLKSGGDVVIGQNGTLSQAFGASFEYPTSTSGYNTV